MGRVGTPAPGIILVVMRGARKSENWSVHYGRLQNWDWVRRENTEHNATRRLGAACGKEYEGPAAFPC